LGYFAAGFLRSPPPSNEASFSPRRRRDPR
jgi:hypothetical protein